MSDLKLLSKPSKYEQALQNLEEEVNLAFHIRSFYQRHLPNFIELNEEHDFLSEYEAQVLMFLHRLLQDGIMEDVSESEVGLSSTRGF